MKPAPAGRINPRMRLKPLASGLLVLWKLVGCSTPVADVGGVSMATDPQASSDSTADASGSATTGVDPTSSSGGSSTNGTPLPKLDVGAPTGGIDSTGPTEFCEVPDDGTDAPGPCDYFDPVLQWEWGGDGATAQSATTPLVANLTDDNNDGNVDLCDTPDVVVLAWAQAGNAGPGYLYVLDGQTGIEHFHIDTGLDDINPALGDIDSDGLPELVAQTFDGGIVAFEHDGTLKWQSTSRVWPRFNAISLADLEGDGDVEILLPGGLVLDHDGLVVVPSYLGASDDFWEGSTPIAMDLDGDGDLEVLEGRRAFHHDGTPMWQVAGPDCPQPPEGADIMPAVADLDGDGAPEVFLSGNADNGAAMFCIVGAGGEVERSQLVLPEAADAIDWLRPPAVHDMDGDGDAEVGIGGSSHYFAVLRVAAGGIETMFVANDLDDTGNAGATAFDFLGDGTAEAIYMDQSRLVVYAASGEVEMSIPRTSYTQIEYPVVADVDNDGSAEFVVTSNGGSPPVRVYRDARDRWVPARRIWNQHAYHVTNVREDGTIPAHPAPHWEQLNTFRTQAQIAVTGGACRPAG